MLSYQTKKKKDNISYIIKKNFEVKTVIICIADIKTSVCVNNR